MRGRENRAVNGGDGGRIEGRTEGGIFFGGIAIRPLVRGSIRKDLRRTPLVYGLP